MQVQAGSDSKRQQLVQRACRWLVDLGACRWLVDLGDMACINPRVVDMACVNPCDACVTRPGLVPWLVRQAGQVPQVVLGAPGMA
jgi:hypothetical protein